MGRRHGGRTAPMLLLIALLAAALTGGAPVRAANDSAVIAAADIETETRVTVDGQTYRIVQLRYPVGPAAVKAAYPNLRRAYLDSAGRPLTDRAAAQKVGLIDSVLRLHDAGSLAELRTLVQQTRSNHLWLQGLHFSTDLVAKSIGKAARAYLTAGATLPADLAQELVDNPQALELKALTEMIVWSSLDDADAAFARAQAIAGRGLADYASARAYIDAYFEALTEFYPTVDYYGAIDHIDNTTLDNLREFGAKAVYNLAGIDAVTSVLDEIKKLAEIVEWQTKRASYQRRHATFIPGAAGYVEPILVRYTQALAAVSHGEAPALGTPGLLSAVARCDGTAPGIALRWTAVDGASRYAIYRDGEPVYLTRSAGITFWNTAGLTAGQTYRYQIQAVNAAGRGALSAALSAAAPPDCAGDQAVSIRLDGETVYADVPPVILDGRTMVPLRAIAEALGAQIAWDGDSRTITLSLGETVVQLAVDDANALVDGSPVTLAVPARIIDGRTLVPLRFLGESFGSQVNWDGATQTVVIDRGSPARPQPELVPLGHLSVTDKLVYRDGLADVKMGGSTQIAARWLDGYRVEYDGPYFLELALDGQYQTLIALVGYADGSSGSNAARVSVSLDGKEATHFNAFGDSVAHPLHLNVAGVRRLRFTVDGFKGLSYPSAGTLRLAGGVAKTAVAPDDPTAAGGPDPLPLGQVRVSDKLAYGTGIGEVRLGGKKETGARWLNTNRIEYDGPYFLEFALDGAYQTLDARIGYADESSGFGARVTVSLDGKEAVRFNVFGDSVAYPLHLNVAGARRLRLTVDAHKGVAFPSAGTLVLAGSVSQLGVPPADPAAGAPDPLPLAQVRLTDKLVSSSGIGDVRMGGSRQTAARWLGASRVEYDGPYFMELALEAQYRTLDALVGYADESSGSDATQVTVLLDGKEAARFPVFGDSAAYPLHLNVAGVRRLRFQVDAAKAVAYPSGGTLRLAGSLSRAGAAPADAAAGNPDPVPFSQVRLAGKLVYASGIADVRLGASRQMAARWLDASRVEYDGPYYLEFALDAAYRTLDALVGYADDSSSGYSTEIIVSLDNREVGRFRVESGGQPRALHLDLAGAGRLHLAVHSTGSNSRSGTFWIAGTVTRR